MIREDGERVHIVEFEKHKDKKTCKFIAKKVNLDPLHKKLVLKFEKKVVATDFVAEEFETCWKLPLFNTQTTIRRKNNFLLTFQ
ncbi:MAG TPA: hypothetical protein VJJ82_00880 [Candidatus Nanoarchaeia archaeon]|nr:hypothetical protein [Candidatus Nanoarchaeia archaeon]